MDQDFTQAGGSSSIMPSQIGSYVIERLLQAGFLYENYRGFDPQKKIAVFIKSLTEQAIRGVPEAREQFSKQVRLMRALDHPHICQFLQAGMEGGRPYLVCEYIEGVTLRDFLIHQMPRPVEALYILHQIASALSYLHQHQIIHNDLKPENILISTHLKATLLDFSIAQSLKSFQDRKIQQLAGTLLYMSPEQQTLKELSIASDLYSFAIIAYELITGRLSHGTLQLAFLPQALQIIFAKALQTDPKLRYKDADAFLLDIECVKDSIAGIHLLARKNQTHDVLIDFDDLYVPFVAPVSNPSLAHAIFIPSSSFNGSKELISTRILKDRWLSVFVDSPNLSRNWLYYLKALLDTAENTIDLKLTCDLIDAFREKFSLKEDLHCCVIEIKDDLCFQAHLCGRTMLFWQTEQKISYEESSGPWKQAQGTLKHDSRLLALALHQMSARQVCHMLQSASKLSCGGLMTFCSLACYRISEYWAKVQKSVDLDKMNIPTLKRTSALIGIQIRTQNS